MQSKEISGDVSFRNEAGGLLTARLTELRQPEDSPGTKPEEPGRSKELPAIDLIAERFTFRDKQFGHVELQAQRAGEDWRVDKVAMINPEASISGNGLWRTAAPSSTSFNFDLDASDSGKLLERLGYPNLVQGGKAKMQGTASWSGDPTSIDYPSLAGEVQLQAENGQFLKIDPGLGKLISLMSLQALPRRLTFDFRDLFGQGFQFDSIFSAARIDKGVMALKDFKMSGSAAEVEMGGEVDLDKETQNLKVRVVPSLGDTVSTVIAVIAPIFAIPAVLIQKALRDPLGHIFAFSYSVTGPWAEPNVTRLGYEERTTDESTGK